MPLVRDWQPSKGRLEVVLRATQGVRNNIPYIYGLKIYLIKYLAINIMLIKSIGIIYYIFIK